jgi:Flp pilus assembly protein CpaB
MEREEAMNRAVQFVIGLVAIGLALGAGFYGRNMYLKEVSTYPVPVPVAPIPAYTVLSSAMFQLREMPRTLEALPYYQSTTDLVGRISTVALPAGLPIPQENAAPVAQFRLADPSLEVLSIPVEPVSAVGGQIRIGERVNLYQVIKGSDETLGTGVSAHTLPPFDVKQIEADVLVVDVRNDQGVTADSNQTDKNATALGGISQNEQLQILTLAVKPESVPAILGAVATAQKQGGLLWTSLAIP